MSFSAEYQLFSSEIGEHIYLADGSRIYDLHPETATAIHQGQMLHPELQNLLPPNGQRYIDSTPLRPPPLQSLSLNVAQACNMGCGYCYADSGMFGSLKNRFMSVEVAKRSVDRLIAESAEGSDLVLGFMGGEPFLNRQLIQAVTPYAYEKAHHRGRRIRFSITTNATLLNNEDVDLLTTYPFTVAVSLDGQRDVNDRQRPMHSGQGSYDLALAGIEKLTAGKRPKHISVRATVTPKTGQLLPILEHLLALQVDEAGFAPVLVSPDPQLAFEEADFVAFLDAMVECGSVAKSALLQRQRFPFSNFETALQELSRGSHRPYPCGAGAGYLSVNAEGDLFACHRLIDDSGFAMGDVKNGSDLSARYIHLVERHVDLQEPCQSCWARYLCGGGCYHEMTLRGRFGCDYIRGWLRFCLTAFVEISEKCPDYFRSPDSYFQHNGFLEDNRYIAKKEISYE